jgi:hypothetical protein
LSDRRKGISMIYEEYEMQCKQQREKNHSYLGIFEKDLMESGLTHKTISKHVSNVDYYINKYLLREDTFEMQEGCGSKIDMFLGYFFIHKCMWSTPGTIKTTAASIKKFYKCISQFLSAKAEIDFMNMDMYRKKNIIISALQSKRIWKYGRMIVRHLIMATNEFTVRGDVYDGKNNC